MTIRTYLETTIYRILNISVNSACREQRLAELRDTISSIVPDITDQCTTYELSPPWPNIVRSRHSVQVKLMEAAVSRLDAVSPISVVDIGDSAGTHLRYLMGLNSNREFQSLSINLDPIAIEKIRSIGLMAIQVRIESMYDHPEFISDADIYLCFETLEHLRDPVTFLHGLASNTTGRYLILSMPYLRKSRVGLHQLRAQPGHIMTGRQKAFAAESTHIFELCPEDWNLVFRFAGWRVVESIRYTQYPKRNPLWLTRFLWRRLNFDGHYGVILQPDDSISSQYLDW